MITFDLARHPHAVEMAQMVISQATDLGVTWQRRTLVAAAFHAAEEVRHAALERGCSQLEADLAAAFVLQVGAEDLADAVKARLLTIEQAKATIPRR